MKFTVIRRRGQGDEETQTHEFDEAETHRALLDLIYLELTLPDIDIEVTVTVTTKP